MTSPSLRALANQIASLRRQVHAQATASQASLRSIEGGSIDVYDDDENLIGVIGLQKDGSVGAVVKSGAKPETPTDPDVQPIPGGAIVAWDGQFEDAQPVNAVDHIGVHLGEDPGFAHDEDTEFAAIHPTGGTVVIPLDDGADQYVKLVAVSKGGVWSDPSAEVFVAAVNAEVAFYQDEFVLTTDGAQDLALTFEPIAFSEHLYWNGLYQREDVAWTREGGIVTLTGSPFPAKAGDLVVVEYAYREDGEIIVPFQSPGWKYLPNLSTGDAVNRSAVAFDDSGWSVAAAPFGDDTVNRFPGSTAEPADYPAAATHVNAVTSMWLRRTITDAVGALEVSVRVDNRSDCYWNGVQQTLTSRSAWTDFYTIAAGDVLPSNVLAVRIKDDGPAAPGNRIYGDVQVTQT